MRLGNKDSAGQQTEKRRFSLKENVLRQLPGAVLARMGSITHASEVAVAK